MLRDPTDDWLLKGLMVFAILGAVVYFYPFPYPAEGYQGQMAAVEKGREDLKPRITEYNNHYPRASNVVLGEPEGLLEQVGGGRAPISTRKGEYLGSIAELKKRIKDKEDASRMRFAPWTEVPDQWRGVPMVYFSTHWDRIRNQLVDEGGRARVEIVDRELGFREVAEKGVMTKTVEQVREYLRELFIAQTVIRLCIKAKMDQEIEERELNKRPEAFMRIISVKPEDSVKIGPYALVPNPQYDPLERNPRSARYQKYTTKEWPAFIQMYPVLIRLQCDVNSFRNFLASVRTAEQFLVIRNLKIVSHTLRQSLKDQNELTALAGADTEVAESREEHIWVELSAAGMDFFEPTAPVKPAAPAADGRKRVPPGVNMGH